MTANSQEIVFSLPWPIARMSLVILAPLLLNLWQEYLNLPRLGAFIVDGICFAIALREQTTFERSQPR